MRTILLLLLISTTCLAQDKIEGIGKFKIGKSNISIMNEVADELKTQLRRGGKDTDLLRVNGKPSVVELTLNTTNNENMAEQATHCPFLKVFYIDRYKISGVDFSDLFLTFRDNILVRIETKFSHPGIVEAITTKYGEGIEEIRQLPNYCLDASESSDIIGRQTLLAWHNGDILAAQYRGINYDKACKLTSSSGFFIEQTSMVSDLQICEMEGWKRAEARKEKAKKNSLKRLLTITPNLSPFY